VNVSLLCPAVLRLWRGCSSWHCFHVDDVCLPLTYAYLNVNAKSAKNVSDVIVAVIADDIIKSIRFLDGRTWRATWSALQSENMTPAAITSITPYQHDTIKHYINKKTRLRVINQVINRRFLTWSRIIKAYAGIISIFRRKNIN